MGAVDDAAKASQTMTAAQACNQTCYGPDDSSESVAQTVKSPRGQVVPSAPRERARSESKPGIQLKTENHIQLASVPPPGTGAGVSACAGANGTLAAIDEEDVAGVEDVRDTSQEGEHIIDLLMRFDPSRLRAEFQPLYLHRLHYFSQQPAGEKAHGDPDATPELSTKSRALAQRVIEREKGESGSSLTSHVDILLWRHNITEAKKEQKRAEARRAEISECSFRPKTGQRPADMPTELTPRGTSRNHVLYERALADKERREMKKQEKQRVRDQNAVQECTFKPDIAKSGRSYVRTQDGTPPVPRGFYKTSQRLRSANEAERQRHEQREDRLAKPTPVSANVLGLERPIAVVGSQPLRQDLLSPRYNATDNGLQYGMSSALLPPVSEEVAAPAVLSACVPSARAANSSGGGGSSSSTSISSNSNCNSALAASFELRVQAWHAHGQQHHMELLLGHL